MSATECSVCPLGEWQSSIRSTTCIVCETDKVSLDRISECESCNLGKHSLRDLRLTLWSSQYHQEFGIKPAEFGASLTGYNTWNGVVVKPMQEDGCGNSTQYGNQTDSIMLIKRGGCEFSFKAFSAQNASARAVIIYNDEPGPAMRMPRGTYGESVSIPVVSVSLSAGLSIIGALNGDTVTVELPAQNSLETICVSCAVGKYSDMYGATGCEKCPSGQFQNVEGSRCVPLVYFVF